MRSHYFPLLAMLALPVAADESTLKLDGKAGPGNGRNIVLVSGDEEYRSEESMPMLAKILSEKHGFDCRVLFSWSADGTHIDPNNQKGVKGWEHLDDADLMIIGTRFRRPTAEDSRHITNFLNAGKPVIGFRTATHAFNGAGTFGDGISYGAFGPLILGEGWVNHHGLHKKEGARGFIEEKNADHPILNSVADIFAPSDVYGIRKVTEDRGDVILMRGAVTKTLAPDSKLVAAKNDPMQAFAWLHPYTASNGTRGTSFCTTAGASVDFVSEDLRRLIINAAYYLTGLDVPEKADVAYVDPFYPAFYGFISDKAFWPGQNMQPADYGIGKSPSAPDPKGTPQWDFRPRKP